MNEGKLDSFYQKVIVKCTKGVSEQLVQNYDNIRKGVEDVMLGPILDLDIIRIHDEGIEEGIKKTAVNMLNADIPIDIISKCTGLSLEELNELKEKPDSES